LRLYLYQLYRGLLVSYRCWDCQMLYESNCLSGSPFIPRLLLSMRLAIA
jgi:hypothetical protein